MTEMPKIPSGPIHDLNADAVHNVLDDSLVSDP